MQAARLSGTGAYSNNGSILYQRHFHHVDEVAAESSDVIERGLRARETNKQHVDRRVMPLKATVREERIIGEEHNFRHDDPSVNFRWSLSCFHPSNSVENSSSRFQVVTATARDQMDRQQK